MEVVESYELPNVLTHPPLTNLSSSEFLNENSGPGVNVQQVLPPVDGGRKAWSFCAAAFVLEALVWGFGFTYGIFEAYYTTHPPFDSASKVAIAAVGPTALAIQYGEGILLSMFLGRYPDYTKLVMWLGLGLVSLSLFLSSFVSQAWLLILLQGVCFGIGGGTLYWPVMVLVSEWFVQRRGLAGGIIFAGSGIGGFIFPFIVNGLLDRVGLPWTLRIWALIEVVLGGIALLGIKSRLPTPKFRKGQPRPRFIPPQVRFLKQPVFWTYSATYFLQSMSFFPVSLYIAGFTTSISTTLAATIVLAIFNSSGVVGQIIIGYLSDRFPYPWIMFISTLGSAVAAFLLWGFANTLAQVFAFAILFGGLAGGFSSVAFAAASDSANPNPEHAPMAMGAFTIVKGIAAIIGPIISGLLLEAGKSAKVGTGSSYGKFGFGPVEIFVGSCAIASSVSSLAVAATRPQVPT